MHFKCCEQSVKDKNLNYVFTIVSNLSNLLPLWQIFVLQHFTLVFKWSSCFSRDALGVHSECTSLDSLGCAEGTFRVHFAWKAWASEVIDYEHRDMYRHWYTDNRNEIWHYNHLPDSHWLTDIKRLHKDDDHSLSCHNLSPNVHWGSKFVPNQLTLKFVKQQRHNGPILLNP